MDLVSSFGESFSFYMLEMDLSSWLFFGVRTKYNGSEDRVQFDKNGNRV